MSERLQWVKQRVISNTDCLKSFNTQMIQGQQMCAIGWDSPWQGGCFGDGGGALVLNEYGTWTQIGIMSFIHQQGCEAGFPVGFTRITQHIDWISKTAAYSFRP